MFLRNLWRWLTRERFAEELEEEMRHHLALRAAELERRGLSPDDARAEARRGFGNPGVIQERSVDVWGFLSIDQLAKDLRFALRRVRQNPAFSVPVILVLALGIGATTAVFSAVDAAFLRPLPFARPDELVTLTNVRVESMRIGGAASNPATRSITLQDVHGMPELFARATAFASGGLNLADASNPVRLNAGVVTVDFFATLGAPPPALGRVFVADEGKPDGVDVVILSYALWQRQFGGGDVIGRSITLHSRPYQVVGVMAPGFSFPNESDLWIPMTVPTTDRTYEPFRSWMPSRVVARLTPTVSFTTASAQLLARWEQRHAASVAARTGPPRRYMFDDVIETLRKQGTMRPLQDDLVGTRDGPLAILMGATALLMLIACTNVANLLLSDAARRRREVAVRLVLGATRGRVVRQLLSEAVLLSVAAALLGVALAPAALGVLRAMLPADLAGVAPAQLDLRVLGFATLLAVGTGIVFGLWPAIGAARTGASETIKAAGGTGTTGRTTHARHLLVGAELALTVMLLVGAGLMLRSFARVMAVDHGMEPERVATLEMSFAGSSQERAERLRVISEVLDRLQAQPGIDAVGAVNDIPLRGGAGGLGLLISVPDAPKVSGDMRFARFLKASGGYFEALGIDLLRGRTFTTADDSLAPRVVIVGSSMARAYWPDQDPVGRAMFIGSGSDTVRYTVVGVVADVREWRIEENAGAQMYLPIEADTPEDVGIVARSSLPTSALLARMRETVRSVDRRQAVYNVRMMEDVIETSVLPRRTNTMLIAIFAGVALLLAALGVYAVVSYSVAQRSREFGIRTALGATGRSILGLVSREIVAVSLAGIGVGVLGAWWLSKVLASLLFGVGVHDPLTFGIVPVILLLPIAIATLIPARRATRLDPTEVMRAD